METSGSSIPLRRKRRKRLELYLLDDNFNTFNYVIEILSAYLPMCNALQAEQMAIITNGSGQCRIYSGFPPEIYTLYAYLQKNGLNVQIREYKPKSK